MSGKFRHFRPNTAVPAYCCTLRLCHHLMGLAISDHAAFSWVDRLHEARQGVVAGIAAWADRLWKFTVSVIVFVCGQWPPHQPRVPHFGGTAQSE